jgi:disulfide bond formation protein DsbB
VSWTPVVTLGLALLTVVALATVIAILALLLLSRISPLGRRAVERLDAEAAAGALWMSALVAFIATAGSLYFSEVARFEPCRLCWYQRIAMYPLAVVLPIAAWRRDIGVIRYALPLALIGAPISVYHYLVELFPALEGGACDPRNPCSLVWFRELGFITLPFMALAAFALIAVLLTAAWRGRADAETSARAAGSSADRYAGGVTEEVPS